MKSLKVFGAMMFLACGVVPAPAQMLKQCVVGMRVIDEAGAQGVITSADGGFCNVNFDNGKQDMRMFYVLRPASGGNTNAGAALANGEYDCAVSSGAWSNPNVMAMGRMDIQGMTYRFRPYGKVTGGFAPYAIGGDGSLRWGGHMGGLDAAPSRLLDSRKTPQGFNVRYLVRQDALADTMSCHHL